MKKVLFLLIAASFAFSCEYDQIVANEPIDNELNQAIAGSWLYIEYGLSPGGGYYTVPVPPDPQNTITFKRDFTVSSTIRGLDKYAHYRLVEDTVTNQQVIAFFEVNPGNKQVDLAGLLPTYYIVLEGDHLIIRYRWCTEGCHMKFKMIGLPEEE